MLNAALALLIGAASPAVGCEPVPGWEAVAAQENVRWLVVGEMHGTREMPEALADLVCLAGRIDPVFVGVEQPVGSQGAIDAFIASDGGQAARAAFLEASIWQSAMKDGRSSEAVYHLFERLRELRAAGIVAGVIAFQPAIVVRPQDFIPEDYEKAMADTLVERTPPGARVVALVGNFHALRTRPAGPGQGYRPMGAFLPPAETITLDARAEGGTAWGCINWPNCGPYRLSGDAIRHPRGIVMASDPQASYSGVFHLGVAATASPPQPGGPADDR